MGLPAELLAYVLAFLDWRDLPPCLAVCRAWRSEAARAYAAGVSRETLVALEFPFLAGFRAGRDPRDGPGLAALLVAQPIFLRNMAVAGAAKSLFNCDGLPEEFDALGLDISEVTRVADRYALLVDTFDESRLLYFPCLPPALYIALERVFGMCFSEHKSRPFNANISYYPLPDVDPESPLRSIAIAKAVRNYDSRYHEPHLIERAYARAGPGAFYAALAGVYPQAPPGNPYYQPRTPLPGPFYYLFRASITGNGRLSRSAVAFIREKVCVPAWVLAVLRAADAAELCYNLTDFYHPEPDILDICADAERAVAEVRWALAGLGPAPPRRPDLRAHGALATSLRRLVGEVDRLRGAIPVSRGLKRLARIIVESTGVEWRDYDDYSTRVMGYRYRDPSAIRVDIYGEPESDYDTDSDYETDSDTPPYEAAELPSFTDDSVRGGAPLDAPAPGYGGEAARR